MKWEAGLSILGLVSLGDAIAGAEKSLDRNDIGGFLGSLTLPVLFFGLAATVDIWRSKKVGNYKPTKLFSLVPLLIVCLIGAYLLVKDSSIRPTAVSSWQEISLPNERCTVLMPGQPMPVNNQQKVDGYTFEQHGAKYDNGTEEYIVISTEYPKKLLQGTSVEHQLSAIVTNMESATGDGIVNQQKVKLDGFPATEVTLTDLRRRSTVVTRICLVRNRMYDMGYSCTLGRENKSNAVAFFNSIHFDD